MQSKTRSDWAVVVAEWRKSGQSQKAFCDARGIAPWKLSYRKARVEAQTIPEAIRIELGFPCREE